MLLSKYGDTHLYPQDWTDGWERVYQMAWKSGALDVIRRIVFDNGGKPMTVVELPPSVTRGICREFIQKRKMLNEFYERAQAEKNAKGYRQ